MPFAKGVQHATRGRPKGAPNKVTKELKDMILEALDNAGGVEYLKQRAIDTPGPFLALIGKVLPMQVNAEHTGGVVIELIRYADKPAE